MPAPPRLAQAVALAPSRPPQVTPRAQVLGVTTNPPIEQLRDAFTANNATVWGGSGFSADIAAASGFLSLTPTSSYHHLDDNARYRLTGSRVLWQMPSTINVGTSNTLVWWGHLTTQPAGGNRARIEWSVAAVAGVLQLQANAYNDANGSVFAQTATYSPVNHQWLSMRESGGNVLFETSANGVTWSLFATLPRSTWPFDLDGLQLVFGTGYNGTDATPGVVQITNLNTPPVFVRGRISQVGLGFGDCTITRATWSTPVAGDQLWAFVAGYDPHGVGASGPVTPAGWQPMGRAFPTSAGWFAVYMRVATGDALDTVTFQDAALVAGSDGFLSASVYAVAGAGQFLVSPITVGPSSTTVTAPQFAPAGYLALSAWAADDSATRTVSFPGSVFGVLASGSPNLATAYEGNVVTPGARAATFTGSVFGDVSYAVSVAFPSGVTVATTAGGSLTLGGAASATGSGSNTATGSLTLGGSATAAAPAAASGTVTLGGTAAAAAPATATGSVTLGGTAAATAGGATATGSLILTGAAAAAAPVTASGSVTLGGTSTAQAPATATGTVTLGGAAAASAPVTASGALSLAGTATAAAGGTNTATGSIALTGTVIAVGAATATGSLTLTGTATVTAPVTASGSIALAGSATARATLTATGALVLAGTATLTAPITVTGFITLSGSAIAAAAGGPTTDVVYRVGPNTPAWAVTTVLGAWTTGRPLQSGWSTPAELAPPWVVRPAQPDWTTRGA